jgi:hypothetical protein
MFRHIHYDAGAYYLSGNFAPVREEVTVQVTCSVRSAATSSYVVPVPTLVAPRVQA